jgi:hypothetical protein
MKHHLAALLIVLSVLAAFAPSASAYQTAGRPWPGGTITYHTSARAYSSSVDQAAAIWNGAGVGVRFVRAPRASAQVLIRYGGRACEGATYAGYLGRRRQSPVALGRGCDRSLIVLTAVHELGHVLGLGHEGRRCARMNPAFDSSGTPSRCRERPLGDWLAQPLMADDLRGARALYG